MSDHIETEVPPVGEQIHVPASSKLPIVLAAGIALAIIGVTLGLELTVIGLVIALPTLVIWIRSAREDIENLPPGH